MLNLIHYDDAADLCVQALRGGDSGAVYLGCDDEPITRQTLVDEIEADCTFNGRERPIGRRCVNTLTRRSLGWEPRFRSFTRWWATLGS